MIHGWYPSRFADANYDEFGSVPGNDDRCLCHERSVSTTLSSHGSPHPTKVQAREQGRPTTTSTAIILPGTASQYSRLSTNIATFRLHATTAMTVEIARMMTEKMNQVLWADVVLPRARRHCLMSRRQGSLAKGGRVSSQDSTTGLVG